MQSIETANHIYTISLTVDRCDRIFTKYKLDLLDGEAQKVFSELQMMPRTRLNILWEMVDDKSDCPKIPNPDHDPDIPPTVDGKANPDYVPALLTAQKSFMDVLEGEVLSKSEEAFWEEVAFFFQNLNPVMSKYIDAMKQKAKEFNEVAMDQFDKLMNGEVMKNMETKAIEKAMKEAEKQLEKSFGN